jgi:hypothetical protein
LGQVAELRAFVRRRKLSLPGPEIANILRKPDPPGRSLQMTGHGLNVPFTTKPRSIQKINRSVKTVLEQSWLRLFWGG